MLETAPPRTFCLVDTNIVLRSADRLHPTSTQAKAAMKGLSRQGKIVCLAKQTLLECWVAATRPRDVNGFGYSPNFAAEGLSKLQRLFHLLAETDDIYTEWQKLVTANQVIGKTAYDARLVAAMNVHGVKAVLTFNVDDFTLYDEIQVIHPAEVSTK